MKFARRTFSASAVTSIACVLAAGIAVPTSASAAGCVGRPGASALEQYCEAVPDARGGRQNPGTGNGSGGSVSPQTAKTLAESGANGAAVAALAGQAPADGDAGQSSDKPKRKSNESSNTSGKSGSGSDSDSDSDSPAATTVAGPADPPSSPLRATKAAVETGPTAGAALTWGVVGLSALGAIGAIALRRRSRDAMANSGHSDSTDE